MGNDDDSAKAFVRQMQRNEKATAALGRRPQMLRDILDRLDLVEDRLGKLEHPTRGRIRDDATAQRENLFQTARDLIDEIRDGIRTPDDAKKLLMRHNNKLARELAHDRGAADPSSAARTARKRHRLRKT